LGEFDEAAAEPGTPRELVASPRGRCLGEFDETAILGLRTDT
jgi:hypothetical protein